MAGGIDGDDGVVGGLEDGLHPLFGDREGPSHLGSLGDVPDDAAEEPLLPLLPRSQRQFDRELVSIAGEAEYLDGVPDDPCLAGLDDPRQP